MKNKILAGVVATMLAVTMLGTVSFANDYTIPTHSNAAQETFTVLAFATDNYATDTPTEANIVAVMQQDTTAPTTLKVASAKVDKDYIVVRLGGSAGTAEDVVLKVDGINPTLASDITVDNTKYTNVAYASFTETVPEGKTATMAAITFSSTNPDSTPQTINVDLSDIEGEGNIEFGAVVLSVDSAAYGRLSADAVLTLK